MASEVGSARDGVGAVALEIQDLHVSLGEARILSGISLTVREGAVSVGLGANGAGKTTLLRTISGMYRPSSGRVLLYGEEIHAKQTHRIARLGVQHVQEGKRVFKHASVLDNLRLGGLSYRGGRSFSDRRDFVMELFPVLSQKSRLAAGSLSGGEQQMLALAQALMAEPKMLLLDEPSSGLAPLVLERLFEVLHTLSRAGQTILLVEQVIERSLEVADDVFLFSGGRIVATGTSKEIVSRPEFRDLYFRGSAES